MESQWTGGGETIDHFYAGASRQLPKAYTILPASIQ
jgi:hypothetical protein